MVDKQKMSVFISRLHSCASSVRAILLWQIYPSVRHSLVLYRNEGTYR